MRVLLDTSIVICVMQDHPMPEEMRGRIDEAAGVYVSCVAIWEIAIKVSIGKLRLDFDRIWADCRPPVSNNSRSHRSMRCL